MKFLEAQALLKKAVHEQKTIDTGKLKRIINSMGISLNKDGSPEVQLLKTQITELREYKAEYERVKWELARKSIQPKGGWRK
jgi:hypothetical protein